MHVHTQVAADCQKYEAYVYSSQTVAAKLSSVQSRLLQGSGGSAPQQQQEKQQRINSTPTGQDQVEQQQQELLLQLCNVLQAAVADNLPRDSLEWLAALELPNANAVQLQQLRQNERELVAAIDATLKAPGGPP